MQNIFIELLPPWIETGLQPAFYDKESGTVLQQVARMWAKMIQLGQAFNTFSEDTTTFVNQFVDDTNEEIERFENATNATVEEYIAKFVELHDYVHDYFDNLDVQKEINNKLDQMAEDGTLQEIITAYIQSNVAWTFDTVADMKQATNLVEGSYARTLGYNTLNDKCGALYKVVATPTDIALQNNLYAEYVVENTTYSIDDFDGETIQDKFFTALDTVTEGTIVGGNITITEQYTALNKDYRRITIVDTTLTLSVNKWFNQAGSQYNSVPAFKNCSIIGNSNTFYNSTTNAVGVMFNGCNIRGTQIFNASYYVQSPYFIGCTFESEENLITAPQLWDFKMIGCRVESGTATLINVTNEGIKQGVVTDCLIEGRTNVVFNLTAAYGFTVTNCYFEGLNGGLISQTGANAACYINVMHNTIFAPMNDTNYVINLNSVAANNARIKGNLTNLPSGKFMCNKSLALANYIKDENINYAAPWKGSGFSPLSNRYQTLNDRGKTATWNADDSSWTCTYQLPYGETNTIIHPIYLFFEGSMGSSPVYQGYAIVRVNLMCGYSDNNITLYGDTDIIAGRNRLSPASENTIGATVTLSQTTSYTSADVLVTVKITGFTSNRGKYRFIDPFRILTIDEEK